MFPSVYVNEHTSLHRLYEEVKRTMVEWVAVGIPVQRLTGCMSVANRIPVTSFAIFDEMSEEDGRLLFILCDTSLGGDSPHRAERVSTHSVDSYIQTHGRRQHHP